MRVYSPLPEQPCDKADITTRISAAQHDRCAVVQALRCLHVHACAAVHAGKNGHAACWAWPKSCIFPHHWHASSTRAVLCACLLTMHSPLPAGAS